MPILRNLLIITKPNDLLMIERWTIISIVLMIDANNSFVLHDIKLTLAKSIELSEFQDNNCNCWMTIEEILLALLIPCKYFNQSFESQFTKSTLIVVFIVNYCKYSLSLDSKASWMTINWKLVELIVFEQQIKLNSACDPSRVECKSSTVRWIPANRPSNVQLNIGTFDFIELAMTLLSKTQLHKEYSNYYYCECFLRRETFFIQVLIEFETAIKWISRLLWH